MSLNKVGSGEKSPQEFNVVVEISANSMPVKYEVDKDSGVVFVDRFVLTSMHYPCNYGYVPNTLSQDGDPTDVLVITPFPVQVGSVIKCRAIGILEMEDESGFDNKILALPVNKIYAPYSRIKSYEDIGIEDLNRIRHFFEHYKDLEQGKWVKVIGWKGIEAAQAELLRSLDAYNKLL
ncbi:MAG: inorganic diphosphatase [Candidatus Kinetoplastibacterium crithidii]|nr:MAG: inorganic diphosphatase [Candidatus Kinetoplastibacterium crithidii]